LQVFLIVQAAGILVTISTVRVRDANIDSHQLTGTTDRAKHIGWA
jgi:hypothetical protein